MFTRTISSIWWNSQIGWWKYQSKTWICRDQRSLFKHSPKSNSWLKYEIFYWRFFLCFLSLWKLFIQLALPRWFKSYLSHRRQCVVLNGVESNWADVLAGVPQGSMLGPLLFLFYINDFINNIRSSIRLFADDTTIFIIIDNPQTVAFILNTDLETINGWSQDWLVDCNPTKTSTLLIFRRQHPVAPLWKWITITSHKHLGLTISNTCSWIEHINKIAETAWSRLNLMRLLKFKINRKTLEKCTLHLFIPYLSIVTRYEITILLIIKNSLTIFITKLPEL